MSAAPLSLVAARARMLAGIRPVAGVESVPLADLAGRILATPLRAPRDIPAADCSAMDGYAVRHPDLSPGRPLRLVAAALAGSPAAMPIGPGECVRITTGGQLPEGADTVVIQEDVERDGEFIRLIGAPPRRGANVRCAGEDMARGDPVLPAGRRLGAIEIGLIAALGLAEVRVRRRLRVALVASGDELRPPGEALAPGQIHDSNRYLLTAMLARLGAEVLDLGIVPDRPEALREAFRRAARDADLVVSCGGASVGDADHTRAVLEQLGEIAFWKVAIKPGKPFLYGRLGAALVCGLPGNPVSALVTFHQLAVPVIRRLQGAADPDPLLLSARITEPLRRNRSRLEFVRARVESDGAGGLIATPDRQQSSAAMGSLARCNAFLLVDAGAGQLAAGEPVSALLFDELF
jgi:molybdopterin molybdotransferase